LRFSRSRSIIAALVLLLSLAAGLAARQAGPARQALSFTVITAEARRLLAATIAGDQVMVALDDLASLFQLGVREVNGTVSVTYKNRSILLTPGQSIVSAGGRLVSLPAPLREETAEAGQPRSQGRRWLVPVEFLARALSAIYDGRIEVRKSSRLVLVGDVRVPRVAMTTDVIGSQLRITMELTPRTGHSVTHEGNRLLVRFDAESLDATVPSTPPQGVLQGLHLEPPSTVVLDLGPRFGTYRAAVSPLEGNASQLVLDLFAASSEPVPIPGQGRPIILPPADEMSPIGPVGLRTIVLDPGHGGDEAGAKGAGGGLEKEITLALARRLR
jgi:N-acetylmuramoyl-L-alanine amidase